MKLAFKAKWHTFLIMQFSIILFVNLKMALELSENISLGLLYMYTFFYQKPGGPW